MTFGVLAEIEHVGAHCVGLVEPRSDESKRHWACSLDARRLNSHEARNAKPAMRPTIATVSRDANIGFTIPPRAT